MTSRREWSSHPLSKSTEWNQHAKYVMWKSLPWLIDCLPVSEFSCQLCYHLSGNATCFSAQPCQVVVMSVIDPNFLWLNWQQLQNNNWLCSICPFYLYILPQLNGKMSTCSGSEWWLLVVNICANFRMTVVLTADLYHCIFQCSLCIINMLLIDWSIYYSIVHWDVCHMRSAGNISLLSQL